MVTISSGLGHQGGLQASMLNISQHWETGACGYYLAVNPILLPQNVRAERHRDGERAGRGVTPPRQYLDQQHQFEGAAGLSGRENAFRRSLSSAQLLKSE